MTKQIPLVQTQEIRLCERMACEKLNLTDEELMERAGMAAFKTLMSFFNKVRAIAVFCGSGHNAGDGFVLARLAYQNGYSVIIYQHKPLEELPPLVRDKANEALDSGVPCQFFDETLDSEVELIVDALLGIGLSGFSHGIISESIELMNESALPILALDIPSGLDSNTGRALGACIKATVTVTFIARKIGLYTLDGPDHCGEIVYHDLGLTEVLKEINANVFLMDESMIRCKLPPRLKNSHKGHFGHVLVIGGGPGMPGAVQLTAMAALRVGAGMVSIATWPKHVNGAIAQLPEAMVYGVASPHDLLPLLEKATLVILGPGLGEEDWGEGLFHLAITAQLPLVIDASALSLLAKYPQHDDNWVLTPHPGEAARLLDSSVETIQEDRLKAALAIQDHYGGSVALKGVGTLVTNSKKESFICPLGNPGMATAGMGDVLSGVIGGLLAQHMDLAQAVKLGVWLHAWAGDEAIIEGERGLLASDLMPYLRYGLKKLMSTQ